MRGSGGVQEGFRRGSGGVQEGFRRGSGGGWKQALTASVAATMVRAAVHILCAWRLRCQAAKESTPIGPCYRYMPPPCTPLAPDTGICRAPESTLTKAFDYYVSTVDDI